MVSVPFTRYFCPLECGWHYDAPAPRPEDAREEYLLRPGEDFQDMVGRLAGDVAMAHARAVDIAFREHLDTHTVMQAVTKAAEFRKERDEARAVRGSLRDRLNAIVTEELPEGSPVLVQRVADMIDEARIRAKQDAQYRTTEK